MSATDLDKIRKQALAGVRHLSVGSGVQMIASIVLMMILARLISPAEFGVVTAALIVITFTDTFSRLGLAPALVHYGPLDQTHIQCAQAISLSIGVVLLVAVYFLAPTLEAALRVPGLTPVLHALSFIFPLRAAGVVAEGLAQRELDYKRLGQVQIVSFIVGYGAVGVVAAVLDAGAWALVLANLAQSACRSAMMILPKQYRARPAFHRAAWNDIRVYSVALSLTELVSYIAYQADKVILSRALGPELLGVYGRATQICALPARVFDMVISRVSFPAMAKATAHKVVIGDAALTAMELTALIALPLSGLVFCLREEMVSLLLGAQWTAAAWPLGVIGLSIAARAGYKACTVAIMPFGHPGYILAAQSCLAVLTIAGTLVSAYRGLDAIANSLSMMIWAYYLGLSLATLRMVKASPRDWLLAHLPGLFWAVVLCGVAVAANRVLQLWQSPPWLRLVVIATLLLLLLGVVALRWRAKALPLRSRQLLFGAARQLPDNTDVPPLTNL